MRRIFLLLMLPAAMWLSSCMDHYYIENDLHGMWQVTSVERYSSGEVTASGGSLYYMFQRSMILLYYRHSSPLPTDKERYIAHFDFVNSDSISMGDFRLYTTGEGNLVTKEGRASIEDLCKFGIFQDYTTFHIHQSKQDLILSSDSANIVLRRY